MLSWNIFDKKCKLDYGSTMSFDGIKRAYKQAFIMKDCELNLTESYKESQLEFDLKEDWIKKTNLFIDAVDVAQFILSAEISQNKNFNNEINLTYRYIELSKVTLKLSKENLEPTAEFICAVKDAIESIDPPRKFREITEEFGQFIPLEIILGGRVYFNNTKKSHRAGDSSNSKFYNFDEMRLLGGKYPYNEGFDKNVWIDSLKDYQNLECIEFKHPISIFQLLPDDLRKEAFESIGKRILYTTIVDCDYYIHEPKVYELSNLPSHISDLIQNEEADCDIFAAVTNTEDSKNVFFNCQILRLSNVKPSIIIHCAQKNFQQREYKLYKLKISLMIAGYDIEFNSIEAGVEVKKNVCDSQNQCFDSMTLGLKYDLIARNLPFFGIPVLNNLDPSNNSLIIGHNFRKDNGLKIDLFSYGLEQKRYVNLPKFTFCTFIILNNDAYKSFPFKFNMLKEPFIDTDGFKFKSVFRKPISIPKYVSLYLPKDNYEPIFLNQKSKRIDVEYVECECGGECLICKSKTLRISKNDHVECIFYEQNTSEL